MRAIKKFLSHFIFSSKTVFQVIVIILFVCKGSILLKGQSCLPEGVNFTSQSQIDAFSSSFPGCTEIEGDVNIEENNTGDITNLRGLKAIHTFHQNVEIHDNTALVNLNGLEGITTIGGGLNIFGNPGLQNLNGLEALKNISNSLGIALNHNLKNTSSLKALDSIGRDLRITDNRYLANLDGLDAVKTIGGYLIINKNDGLLNLHGLEALTSIGYGLLIENNASLRSLNGLSAVHTVGGNCMFINNPKLQSLRGIDSLNSVGGNLQIAQNPFLEDISSLSKLTRIDGILLIFENVGLKSLVGLDSIDPRTIVDLAILDSDILTTCGVKSICDYLSFNTNSASISFNGTGCNYRAQILESCQRKGQSSSPPKRTAPLFFPNPTGGITTLKGQGYDNAPVEVVDGYGRILIKDQLNVKSLDLSELAAGIYFVKLSTEKETLTTRIVKLN